MKGETIWMFLDVSGNYEIEDSRYYEDDVTRLVSLSLLRVTYNARGETQSHSRFHLQLGQNRRLNQ